MSPALFLMCGTPSDAPSIIAAIMIGLLATIPMSWWSIFWFRQRFDGRVVWYTPEDHKMRLGVLLVVVPLGIVGAYDRFTHSSAMAYVFVALNLSWLVSTLYLIVWIVALEHKLGHKVIEHTRPVSFE